MDRKSSELIKRILKSEIFVWWSPDFGLLNDLIADRNRTFDEDLLQQLLDNQTENIRKAFVNRYLRYQQTSEKFLIKYFRYVENPKFICDMQNVSYESLVELQFKGLI